MKSTKTICQRPFTGLIMIIVFALLLLNTTLVKAVSGEATLKPARLRLELAELKNDIAEVRLLFLDPEGVIIVESNKPATLGLSGDGSIIDAKGSVTGPQTIDTKQGRASLFVRLNGGTSVLSAGSDGLETVFIKLNGIGKQEELFPPDLGPTEMFAIPERGEVLKAMNSVADWQLENLPEPKKRGGTGLPWYTHYDWTNAALYTGVMAHWETTLNRKYLDLMISFAEEVEWQAGPRLLHADDHVIGQVYAEIYMQKKDEKMIKPIIDRIDEVMADPISGRELWDWCDALYMAPPTLTRLYHITGNRKYLDYMDKQWWDATDLLYDKEEQLYFRDHRFIIQPDGSGRREPSGDKVFWSRGNGWVLAGIARLLQYMPDDYPQRHKYEQLFREMAGRIAGLQGEDGLWKTSLLYPQGHGESSGSGFFVYALAWGVNQGILPGDIFMPYALRGWYGLNRLVQPSGKLGWTQQIGFAPDEIHEDMSEVYGAGAFLLAGSEIIKF